MAKSKKNKNQPTQPAKKPEEAAVQLEETFEQATDAVRGFFTQYRVPLIVGVCAILVVFAIMSITESVSSDSVLASNAAFHNALEGDGTDAEKKAAVEKVIADHEGDEAYAWMTVRYASWLMNNGDESDRSKAIALVQEAAQKDDDPLLKVVSTRYAEVGKLDSGFEVPAPPVPDTPPAIDVVPPVTPTINPTINPTVKPAAEPEVPAPAEGDAATPPTSQPSGG
ncbi:MAG: hypothetical protein AAF488_08560 [Planctomycetota bacterium]